MKPKPTNRFNRHQITYRRVLIWLGSALGNKKLQRIAVGETEVSLGSATIRTKGPFFTITRLEIRKGSGSDLSGTENVI